MSHASNRRALHRLKQQRGLARNPYVEAVYETDRLFRAVEGITGFARMLAGMEERRVASVTPVSVDNVTETAPRVDHPPPRSHRAVWSETVRPGPHDVLTWDEAMRIPWLDENAAAD